MTREEARKILKSMSDISTQGEAIDMAIEALSADTVSPCKTCGYYTLECPKDCEYSRPSADAVDCTDFIEWLVDRVLDETIWENNSVAYGEIICRKLEKLGVLDATEEPSYYCLPLAESVVQCKDCINYETCNLRLSHWWKGGYTVDIEFCSFGEREKE